MKLVEQYQSFYDAELIALELRRAGVLARVSDNFSNTHSFASGAFKVGLWVVLDRQYDDAIGILKSENYEVVSPLSEAQMNAIEEAGKIETTKLFANIFNYLASGLIALFVLGYIGYAVYKLG